jgi:hypothetical protein
MTTKYEIIRKRLEDEQETLMNQLIDDMDFLTGLQKGVLKYKPIKELTRKSDSFEEDNIIQYLFTDESKKAFRAFVRTYNASAEKKLRELEKIGASLFNARVTTLSEKDAADIEKKLEKILA